MEILIVAHSHSVRSLLQRAVSRPDLGLLCLGELDRFKGVEELESFRRPEFVIMDPEGLEPSKIKKYLAIWRVQGAGVILLQSHHEHQAARTPGELRYLSKPGTPGEWERLVEELPRLLLEFDKDPGIVPQGGFRILAIGASAGGPAALVELLDALEGKSAGFAILLVQHIGPGFEEGLLSWIGQRYPEIGVGPATDGEELQAGTLRLALPGQQFLVDPTGRLRLDKEMGPVNGHQPSIDVLFHSLCSWPDPGIVAGVLLSGMGRDGASGLMELRRAGALTLVQDAASSIVYGMPRAAMESGAAELALAPSGIGEFLCDWIRSQR